jgi:glutamine cyclotransferase
MVESKHLSTRYRKLLQVFFFAGFLVLSLFSPFRLLAGELSEYLTKSGIPRLQYEILARFPHDPSAFTQGLLFWNGMLYESTGLYGQSTLRQVEPQTGRVLEQVALDGKFFGEGLALWNTKLVQLTWREQTVLFWDLETLRLEKMLSYPFEGWGLAFDGEHLVASDGSSTLRFLNPENLSLVREVTVTAAGHEVDRLNELEYAAGKIYANLWYEDLIVVVDPQSGAVVGWLDCSPLRQELGGEGEVMNGIAFDPECGNFYLTGKNWPWMFLVRIKE